MMSCKVAGVAVTAAVSVAAFGAYGIVFPDDFDYSKGYAMCSASDGGGLNAAIENTFFTKAVWKESADGPLVSAQAGKNYFQNGYGLNGPFVATMTSAQASPYLTFPGNKLVLGSGSGTDSVLNACPFNLYNGSASVGETGLADASTKPYFFGGEGLFMAGSCRFALGRHGAVAGTLTVLSDDKDDYRVAQTNKTNLLTDNIERWTKQQCSGIMANDHGNGWSIDLQANLIGGESAFLVFYRDNFNNDAARPNVCIVSGTDNSGYHGTFAVETNCVLRFKTPLPNGKVKVGYRGWGLPVKTGTDGNREYAWANFDRLATGMGNLEVPAATAVTIGRVENRNGSVQAKEGATLTVGDLVYKGGEFVISSSATACGKIICTESLEAEQKPIRIRVTGALPETSNTILTFPASANLTAADFAVSSDKNAPITVKTEEDVTTVSILNTVLGVDEKIEVGDIDLTGTILNLAISPNVGHSASLTVTGSLELRERPLRISLDGSENAMPQGEMVKLLSWRTADNPALEPCDFDFTRRESQEMPFGMTGIGRGYPVVKNEGEYTTLYLDCTEILYNGTDSASGTLNSCFTNAAGWADLQMPHLDANYFPHKNVCGIKKSGTTEFPGGELVRNQTFHGNRFRLLRGEGLTLEGNGNVFEFPGEGLVLQQGGFLWFLDPGVSVSGTLTVASHYSRPTSSKTVNVSGIRNGASNVRTYTTIRSTLVGDRRAELTVQVVQTWALKRGFDCTFNGDTTGYYGNLICETNTTIFLDTGLPNGTVTLGGVGFPYETGLGSLDGDNNGKLSASVSDTVIAISNLVVNGSTVVVSNGNTYALKALTLNGGLLDVSAFGSAATQLAVDGPVAVTHMTKVALAKRPTCRKPLKLISWPTAQFAPDTSLLTLVKPDGSSWGAKCALTIETDGDVTYLTARSPDTGFAVIVR